MHATTRWPLTMKDGGWSIALTLTILCVGVARADWNGAQIRYSEAVTRIVQLTAADGPTWLEPDDEPSIHSLTASGDGTKVAFIAQDGSDYGIYVVNADGGNLVDLTPLIPPEMENNFGSLQLDQTGERLFFFTNYGEDSSVYYIELSNQSLHEAVANMTYPGLHKHYVINTHGTRVFFRHATGNDISERGLFYADIGQPPVQAMRLDQVTEYNDLALIDLIDVAADGSRMIFVYGGWGTGGAGRTLLESMWSCQPGGTPERFPDEEHRWVWDYQGNFLQRRLISSNGQEALYVFTDRTDEGTHYETRHVDFVTDTNRLLSEVRFSPISISPRGDFALLHGTNRQMTRVNLITNEMIDTYASGSGIHLTTWAPKTSSLNTSATRYFVAGDDEDGNAVFRVDIADSDIGLAPQISDLQFDGGGFYIDPEKENRLKLRATVHDPTGQDNLDWVKATYIFAGLTRPEWYTENPYSHELYDDGEQGDDEAGDEFFTFNEFGPPRDSYFDEHILPEQVGVRFIARSTSGHFSIVDTTLILTDYPLDTDGGTDGDGGEPDGGEPDGGDGGEPDGGEPDDGADGGDGGDGVEPDGGADGSDGGDEPDGGTDGDSEPGAGQEESDGTGTFDGMCPAAGFSSIPLLMFAFARARRRARTAPANRR